MLNENKLYIGRALVINLCQIQSISIMHVTVTLVHNIHEKT